MKKKRPLSPHITIYKPQISSVLSIMHRATGIFLFINSLILIWGLIFILAVFSGFIERPLDLSWMSKCICFKLYVLMLLACLYYHLCNGARHLFFDLGKGMEIKSIHLSGWLVMTLTAAMTIFSAIWLLS